MLEAMVRDSGGGGGSVSTWSPSRSCLDLHLEDHEQQLQYSAYNAIRIAERWRKQLARHGSNECRKRASSRSHNCGCNSPPRYPQYTQTYVHKIMMMQCIDIPPTMSHRLISCKYFYRERVEISPRWLVTGSSGMIGIMPAEHLHILLYCPILLVTLQYASVQRHDPCEPMMVCEAVVVGRLV